MSDFPITLAFPPQGHFTQPHLAIPCLVAYLRAQGFDDVEQRDLSIEAYDHFLSRDYLADCAERARARLPLDPTGGGDSLAYGDARAFRAAAETAVSAEVLIERIDQAKAVLRGEAFYDTEAYVPAARALFHGLRLVSAAHYPSELTPHNFTMGYANDQSAQVQAALVDEEQNPFLRYFREEVLPGLVERRPRVLGLSVVYGSQLIPTLTLARLVKQALPECHITAGGGFLAYIGRKLMQAPGTADCLDSLIFHEGEGPLAALCAALEGGAEDLSEIGSLTWFDRRGEAPITVENPPMHPLKLDQAPAPDFEGLPFDKYLSPDLVLPFDINRGCYYGECTFCTLPTVIGPGYRTRKAETIADQVVALRDRHGVTHFNFITDCMPPGMIRDLPEALLARDAGVTWWSDARVEPKAYTVEGARRLYESGCRKLLFGFETATPRLLKLMKKGQSLRGISEVSRNCAEAGISVTWYAMVGFPSETLEEARASLAFITEHEGIVREVSLQTFHVDEQSHVYRDPAAFDVEMVEAHGADLALYHDYRAKVGMTQEEAAEAFGEMMAGFRRHLPIFAGDTILYFMQKSHYFLHLAHGTTPDEFAERCRQRANARLQRDARPDLALRAGFTTASLPFSYTGAVELMGHPLARAARPDFLTGRYVADAEAEAAARLAPLPRSARVLAYDAENHDFVELRPDGLRVLRALEGAGNLGALLEQFDPALPGGDARRARLTRFAADLHRAGLLAPNSAQEPLSV
jgi:anaerobic magnesium-protoporphyrin IX monomethyl ester cyclase